MQLHDTFVARVLSQHGAQPLLSTPRGPKHALVRGNLMDDPPVVGDTVRARWIGEQVLVEGIEPRTTTLQRRRVDGGRPQILAANVDLVLAICALGRDLNRRRLERYVAAARGAGCETRIVLTKADTVDDASAQLEALGIEALLTSATTGQGIEELRARIGSLTTVLIGTSGAGKSTLINALAGAEVRATGEVSSFGKGKHTTTTRDMVAVGDGWIIDTPGMREFGLAEDADADAAFEDIGALGERCGFRDCEHQGEPDCAVAEAIAKGELHPDRLQNYQKLLRELAYERRRTNKRAASEQRRAWARKVKSIHHARKERGW